MASIIYNLNGTDKTLILDTRASFLQPFIATNWTDLRLSAMVSIVKQSDPNDPTGLAETIGAGEDNNQMYMGFKSSDGNLPPSTNFFGISTQKAVTDATATQLQSLITPNGWGTIRVGDGTKPIYISNGTTHQNQSFGGFSDGTEMLGVVQAQYAVMIMIRMVRTDPTLSLVQALWVGVNPAPDSNGVIPAVFQALNTPFSDTSINNIRTVTAALPSSQTNTNGMIQVGGPFTFTSVPDAIYFYWPFNNSRLRIHSYVLEKYA